MQKESSSLGFEIVGLNALRHSALMLGDLHTAHKVISSLWGLIEDHTTEGTVFEAALQTLQMT